MGWFFNKSKNDSQQNNHQDPINNSESSYLYQKSFYSKNRTCQNDPEDDQYMICKTVIQDNNGTREEQQRVPKNNTFGNGSQNGFGFSDFGTSYPLRNPQLDNQRAFNKLNSFFVQPSFFDFHNSAPPQNLINSSNPNQKIQSFSRSFLQSRKCHSDPQDNQYLICKSKVYDGKQTKEVEERVKTSEQFKIPSFSGQFANIGHQIDRQIHDFMRDINQGFNFLMPFVGPIINFVNDLQNIESNVGFRENRPNQSFFPKNKGQSHKKPEQKDSRYFSFSNPKKDTNVYDL